MVADREFSAAKREASEISTCPRCASAGAGFLFAKRNSTRTTGGDSFIRLVKVRVLFATDTAAKVCSKITHATGFSQWLMTNFFLSAEFIQRKLEGTASPCRNFVVGHEPDPPRKLAD